MLTAKEVIDFIYSKKLNTYDIEYFQPIINEKANGNKTISIKPIEQHGGEGMGDTYYVVLETECDGNTQYWMVPGYYQSYVGSNLYIDETYEVEKAYKQIIDWKKIN